MLIPVPLRLRDANDIVARWHRHHKPSRGHRFSIGAVTELGDLVGCVIVGRPVNRNFNQDLTAEVVRCATNGHRNACSFLYGAAARAAQAMGFWRIQTYVLSVEPGTSLRAVGWTLGHFTEGGAWVRSEEGQEHRNNDHPLMPKQYWFRDL